MSDPKPRYSVEADGMTINLRQPLVAGLLAFLMPGAGHWYQGRYHKAGLYFLAVMSLYMIGMVIGSGRVVYASWTADDRRWPYVCQVAVGLPALPAAFQSYRVRNNQAPWFGGFMAAPESTAQQDEWHKEASAGFDLGTIYTMIAGLLNLLIIFDAIGGPLPLPTANQRKKRRGTKNDDANKTDASDSAKK